MAYSDEEGFIIIDINTREEIPFPIKKFLLYRSNENNFMIYHNRDFDKYDYNGILIDSFKTDSKIIDAPRTYLYTVDDDIYDTVNDNIYDTEGNFFTHVVLTGRYIKNDIIGEAIILM